MDRVADINDDRWCILRTGGARTLALAASLVRAGFTAWAPIAIKRQGVRRGAQIVEVEKSHPIAPTFVFADARQMIDLAVIAAQPANEHPPFSIFQRDQHAAIVSERSLAGLRAAEAEALIAIQAKREEVARVEHQRKRADAMRTEKQRRKAMKAMRREFEPGLSVKVSGAPMLAGLNGTVIESRGKSALVAFGGSLTIEIEAWQIIPHDLVKGSLLTA